MTSKRQRADGKNTSRSKRRRAAAVVDAVTERRCSHPECAATIRLNTPTPTIRARHLFVYCDVHAEFRSLSMPACNGRIATETFGGKTSIFVGGGSTSSAEPPSKPSVGLPATSSVEPSAERDHLMAIINRLNAEVASLRGRNEKM